MAKTTVPIELSSTPSIVDNGNATAITIDSSENIGIGVSPSYRFDIRNSNDGHVARITNNGTNAAGRGVHIGAGNTDVPELPTYQPYIYCGASDGASNSLAIVSEGGTSGTGGINFWTGPVSTGVVQRMRLDRSGNLLVGRTNLITFSINTTDGIVLYPNRLDVSAASLAKVTQIRDSSGTLDRFYNGNSIVGSITCTTSATSYNTSSDYRLKENVVDMDGAINRVKALQPKRFNFIADADTTVDGFLAHEVSEVIPEAINGEKDAVDEEGNPVYQGIDQSKLVPLLTGALKEAIAKIETLEARITALEGN